MKCYLRISVISLAIVLVASIYSIDVAYGGYPERKISVIVPYGPGGGTDRIFRILSSASIDHFGVPWHVQNIPGASGMVGWREALNRSPDGYTIVQVDSTPSIAMLMEKKSPITPFDIKIVCYVAGFRSIAASRPGTEWDTWEKFKTYAKKNPGKITFAGTMSNMLGGAYFLGQAGLEVNYVPYPATGDAVSDFLGGHVDVLAATASTIMTLIPSKAIGIVNMSEVEIPEKFKEFKGMPSAKSLGYRGTFFPRVIGVHPDTSDEIVNIIDQKTSSLLKDKSVNRLIDKLGEELTYLPRPEAEKAWKDLQKQLKDSIGLLKKK